MFEKIKAKMRPTVSTGRISQPNTSIKHISPYAGRTQDNLKELRRRSNAYDAIEYITRVHPDARMAMTTMLRLANSGNTMEFNGLSGRKKAQAEKEWRDFCIRVNAISNDGLDGLINQFHKSSIQFGGMGCEVVVEKNVSDIKEVYPISPRSIYWEMEERSGDYVWIPYQWQNGNRIDLSTGNFFWVALDPNIGKPTGTLMYESALQPIDYQWQFQQDLTAVLRRVGYPRNDLSIDREAVLKGAPARVRNDPKLSEEYFSHYFDFVKRLLRRLEPTDDFIHYSDIVLNGTGGANGDNSRTIDIRAYNEIVDPQVMNGLGCLSVLLNRTTGITESWGTVQFQIVTKTIDSLQRGSKRLIENIANIWLQIHGYSATAMFHHNPVDYKTELQKLETELKKIEAARKKEEYEWIDMPTAIDEMGIKELPDKKKCTNNKYQYLTHMFDTAENMAGTNPPSKQQPNTKQNE